MTVITTLNQDSTVITDNDDDDDDAMVMVDRGAMLRKLRELEAEDEKLRQITRAEEEEAALHNNGSSSEDTLHYDSYLQKQAYYDDYKHVNYRYIDFGYVTGTTFDNGSSSSHQEEEPTAAPLDKDNNNKQVMPLMIEQDRGVSTKGGFVWDAGVILAEHIVHEQAEWKRLGSDTIDATTNTATATATATATKKPIQMVELGAGTGITGLYVATAMKAEVHMAITDLPELLPLMEKNLAHNPHSATNCTAFPLAWGNNVTGNYDVILGADVVAGIYDPVKLAQTVCDLCHSETIVYLACNSRLHEIITTFETAMEDLFGHLERRAPVSRNKNPHVFILVATGKRSNQ